MALVYIDDYYDPWLSEYDACQKLYSDIVEYFTTSNKDQKLSEVFANVAANRRRLKQYHRDVQQLKSEVYAALKSKFITVNEAERRIRQIEVLESRGIQLQNFYSQRLGLTFSRTSLRKSRSSAFADGGTTSWAADDDDDNDDDDKTIDTQVSIADLKAEQQKMLQEQDKGLEELCKVIARQKEIGQTINNEVDHQTEIIDDLADHMDRTDESLINKTKQVQTISFKDRTCGYWVVIILLFACIIVVSLV